MAMNDSKGADALEIRIVLMITAFLFLTGSAFAETVLWDESQGSPLPFTWNSTNFDGFNVGGVGTENLTVLQTDMGSDQRTIAKGNLTYSTTAIPRKLNVVIALNLTDNQAMTDKGLEQAAPGKAFDNGEYYILNWQAERYAAVNRKVDKLAKVLMEQGISEKKTMMVGETWDIGDGWTLYLNAIDAKAMPRQVWISLYKNGIKKDDKVISEGTEIAAPIYTYVEQIVGGEYDVPVFVTYAASIFPGESSDLVQFGGTWLLSTDVNVIQPDLSYGIFRDAMVEFNKLKLMNSDIPVTLAPNSTIGLIGNIKFKVIDDPNYLKFFPSDEPLLNISAFPDRIPEGTPTNVVFTVTSGASPIDGALVSLSGAANWSGLTDVNGQTTISITAAYEGNITAETRKEGYTTGTTTVFAYGLASSALDSWILEENYVLNLTGIDPRASPRQARLQLSKNGLLVKDSVAEQGSRFEYCPGNCIFNATVDVIFNGTQGVAVGMGNASQYSEINGTPLMIDAVHLFRSANFTGISWLLDEGYDMRMMDIDHRSYPRLVWFELLKNGTVMDDAFISEGDRYNYSTPLNSTIITALADSIFKGETNKVVKLAQVYQYSEYTGSVLLDNASHSYISGEITRTDQPLYEGYNLSVLDIDVYGSPRQMWLRLYKNDTMVDDEVVALAYQYSTASGIILSAEVSAIFAGRPLSAVQFRNVTQYSEIDRSELISNATYTISLYGTPLPVPIPSFMPSAYGTYEIRGTPTAGLQAPIVWTPQNFAGFYYDINSNTGKEELNILQPDLAVTRTIDNGNLTYSTTAQSKMLYVVKYAFGGNVPAAEASGLAGFDNGSYYLMGWQGERYTALNGRADKLAGLVLEQGTTVADKKTLAIGESWDIGGNWTLTVQSIDVKAYPRHAWLTLGKDGVKIEDIFVAQQNIYTYVETNFSNETDVPLFMTYLDSVFAGATTDMVQLRYTWALNTSVKEIMHNETYGIFTDAEVSPDKTLKLKNSNTNISLARGSTIDLMGPLRFRVADNDSLRFIPVAVYRQAGIVDIRGAVWNETPVEGFGGIGFGGSWNASNFAGFFYDVDNDLGKEELNVLQADLNNYQRTIYQNNLFYTTSSQPKMLNLVKYAFGGNVSAAAARGLNFTAPGEAFEGGSYQIIGWQGEKHVAVNGMVNMLNDFILEQGAYSSEKKVMFPNETWNVGGGWSLTLDFVDAKSSPRIAGITLRKDGEFMDSRVLTSGPYGGTNSVYTYAYPNTSMPLFVAYVDSIFAGAYSDMAQFRYTWAVSPEVTYVNAGDRFGVFNVTEVNTTTKMIGLRNIDTAVTLSQYPGTVELMSELKFRVANDDSVLRFYPFKRVTTQIDTAPPGSIFGLRNISYAEDYITWMWVIPADADFAHTQVYLDGNFTGNLGQSRSFTASGLAPDTEHTISTHTVDTSGNVNTTWVNHTARTAAKTSSNEIISCSVISAPGNYVLTQDITNSTEITCIVINTGDVVLDGAGHTIDGVDAMNSTGVYVSGQRDVTVKNLQVTDWHTGIYYQDATNGSIVNNYLNSNSYAGINLVTSIFSHGGVPGYFTISQNSISNSDYGILMISSGYNNITGNNVTFNRYSGIALWFSNNNNIDRNTAVYNGDSGIYLEASVNNALNNNSVAYNALGITLFFISDGNSISGNMAFENDAGFFFGHSDNPSFTGKFCTNCHPDGQIRSNTLTENIVTSNRQYGIFFNSSGSNTIYNNLFNNGLNYGSIFNGTNVWNITKTAGTNIIGGPYLGGNVWADPYGTGFSQTCVDYNGDSICESTYAVDGSSIDYLPLMNNVMPPGIVTNLTNITYSPYQIIWTWNDPMDTDLDHVQVFIDGVFKDKVKIGTQQYNASGFAPDSEHTISTRTIDAVGNINLTWVNHTAKTAPLADTTPPGSVTGLHNITYATDYITWTWNDPEDPDFEKVMVYLNGVFQRNVTPELMPSFNATGLLPGTTYTISIRTVDIYGNINSTFVSHNATTALFPDTVPPGSVNDLRASVISKRYIVWRWTDPADADFNEVIVYLDGRFMTNVTKGTGSYTAMNLKPNSVHTISTRTVDITGNINQTWVNNTTSTGSLLGIEKKKNKTVQ